MTLRRELPIDLETDRSHERKGTYLSWALPASLGDFFIAVEITVDRSRGALRGSKTIRTSPQPLDIWRILHGSLKMNCFFIQGIEGTSEEEYQAEQSVLATDLFIRQLTSLILNTDQRTAFESKER